MMRLIENYLARHQGSALVILGLVSFILIGVFGADVRLLVLIPIPLILPHLIFIVSLSKDTSSLKKAIIGPEGKTLKELSRLTGLRPKRMHLIMEISCRFSGLDYRYKSRSGLYEWRSDVPKGEPYHRLYFIKKE